MKTLPHRCGPIGGPSVGMLSVVKRHGANITSIACPHNTPQHIYIYTSTQNKAKHGPNHGIHLSNIRKHITHGLFTPWTIKSSQGPVKYVIGC